MAKGEHAWAANHLPKVYYSEDVVFPSDSTFESVARLFENAKFTNGDYVYERRTLRIIIQERLYPLKSLTNVKDIGQVILDVACVHHWLYDEPGILHRDLSFNNIMHRLIKWKNAKGEPEQKVYGVLTDYDLSSWTESLNPDYTKTLQQRTGTPPYMAKELLQGTSSLHLYRHDVESLFYIMLLMSVRHTIGTPKGEEKPRVHMRGSTGLPYQDWFNEPRYRMLGALKEVFFSNMQDIELSPVFEDFRPWLMYLQHRFLKGFKLRPSPSSKGPLPWDNESVTVEFNDETLGGYIEYSTILSSLRYVTGQLKGLIIRDPKNPLVPAQSSSAGAARGSD